VTVIERLFANHNGSNAVCISGSQPKGFWYRPLPLATLGL
jgi:hypothetical protein